jgi:hypothetical protein
MTRYFAWNRTKSDPGVQSSRTSVSLSGSAFFPCQSALNRKGTESSQQDGGGNPSASGSSDIRTATAIFFLDDSSFCAMFLICFQCSPALQLRRSSQNKRCSEMHKEKTGKRRASFFRCNSSSVPHESCSPGLRTICAPCVLLVVDAGSHRASITFGYVLRFGSKA